jgi:hypothetical protein
MSSGFYLRASIPCLSGVGTCSSEQALLINKVQRDMTRHNELVSVYILKIGTSATIGVLVAFVVDVIR